MVKIVAQVAPQRSTQYTAVATALAPHELALSPLGDQVSSVAWRELGGQAYLQFELPAEPNEQEARELGTLALTSAFFLLVEELESRTGPWLRPIETYFQPYFPFDLVMARRYRGKTNEMFTHFLCNVARFSSEFAHRPWNTLRVFDPLAGGGTTLFMALVLGAEVAGVEKNLQDVESTAAFLRQYAREKGIRARVAEERLQKLGRRWWFTLGKEPGRRALLAAGETARSAELTHGFKKPHLIVTDLPYGIQHQGKLAGLLGEALPVWAALLSPGGALVFAWESSRLPREEMVALVEAAAPLRVLSQAPYDLLAHRVDRVIKRRDLIVTRPVES